MFYCGMRLIKLTDAKQVENALRYNIMVETRNSKLKKQNSTLRIVEKGVLKRNVTETLTQPTKRARKTKEATINKVTIKSEPIATNIKPTLSSIHAQLAAQA